MASVGNLPGWVRERMPQDGSARAGTIERVVSLVTAVACAVALVWIACLLTGHTGGPDAREGSAVAVLDGSGSQGRVMDGAYASWLASDGCSRGHDQCVTALREANERVRPYGLRVFEDGSMTVR